MKNVSAKNYLSQGKWIEQEIKCLQEEREELFAKTLKNPIWSDMKVQSSRTKDTEDIYIILTEYADWIASKYNELVKKRYEISKELDKLEDKQLQYLLRMRYVMGFKWETIAEVMGYDERYIYKLHGKALQYFGEKMTLKDSKE